MSVSLRRRGTWSAGSVLVAVAALMALPGAARAELAEGDSCRLAAPLVVKLRQSVQGSVQTELVAGTELTVTDPGLQVTRVLAGEVEALAPTAKLEDACAPARERCVLDDAIKMASRSASGRQRVFKVKAGAVLSVLERGKLRSRVRVDGVDGRVNSAHLAEKCRPLTDGEAGGATATTASVPAGPAPRGVRVAVIAFGVAPSGSAVDARAFEDEISEALAKRRRDVMAPRDPRPAAKARFKTADEHQAEAARLGKQLGVPFVITGHLARDGEHRVLSLSVYDVTKGRVVRRVRARPTYHRDDPWADVTSQYLNEALPGAS